MSSISLPAGDVYIPIKVEEGDDIYNNILALLQVIRPQWNTQEIKFKKFTDGITNKLIACYLTDFKSDDIILVRIYGNKTDLLIDRSAELRNLKCLNAAGLAPSVYAVFENGLIYQYCPGCTLNPKTVTDSHISTLVARQMAKMHKVEIPRNLSKEPMLWDKIEQFLRLLPEPFSEPVKQERFVKSFGSVTKLRIEFERLRVHLSKSKSPIVLAHNDLLLGNVIYNQDENKVSFIDYEYTAPNYQAFDIANHFNEFVGISIDDIDYDMYPNKSFQKRWIITYLSEFHKTEDITDDTVERVYKEVEHMTLASHFLWGIWSLVQYEHSHIDFDFGRYAEIRLSRYFETKDGIIKELM